LRDRCHPRGVTGITAKVAILTVTDSRTLAEDESGDLAQRILEREGHSVSRRYVVKNDAKAIGGALDSFLSDPEVDAIITIGGTGVSRKDMTVDVVARMLQKRLEGFGELFRAISFRRLGSSAMMSRALAGVCSDKAIFCVPGSKDAVRTAVKRLIAPELGHVIFEVRKT